jgi:hypothetical protein
MTITTTWAIAQLEHETADGFVFTAHWTASATNGEFSASSYGSIGFERPDNLIPYEDLTEEIVVGWVKEEFGKEKVDEIEAALAANIESQIHPTRASGMPWETTGGEFSEESAE